MELKTQEADPLKLKGIQKACCTCLCEDDLKCVFTTTYEELPISEILDNYFSIIITKENASPKHICDSCLKEVIHVYSTIETFQQTQETIKSSNIEVLENEVREPDSKRSKIEYNKLNFEKVCRTCLAEDQFQANIFEVKHDGQTLSKILDDYIFLKTQPDDIFPQRICKKCVQSVVRLYSFKIKCATTRECLEDFNEDMEIEVDVVKEDVEESTEQENEINLSKPSGSNEEISMNDHKSGGATEIDAKVNLDLIKQNELNVEAAESSPCDSTVKVENKSLNQSETIEESFIHEATIKTKLLYPTSDEEDTIDENEVSSSDEYFTDFHKLDEKTKNIPISSLIEIDLKNEKVYLKVNKTIHAREYYGGLYESSKELYFGLIENVYGKKSCYCTDFMSKKDITMINIDVSKLHYTFNLIKCVKEGIYCGDLYRSRRYNMVVSIRFDKNYMKIPLSNENFDENLKYTEMLFDNISRPHKKINKKEIPRKNDSVEKAKEDEEEKFNDLFQVHWNRKKGASVKLKKNEESDQNKKINLPKSTKIESKLIDNLFVDFTDDPIDKVIKNDKVFRLLALNWCIKNGKEIYLSIATKQKLRFIAKYFLNVKRIDSSMKTFESTFVSLKYDRTKSAIAIMRDDENLTEYEKKMLPYLKNIIANCVEVLILNNVITKIHSGKFIEFLKMHQIPPVKIFPPPKIDYTENFNPILIDDIRKLHKFLKKCADESFDELENDLFTYNKWFMLVITTMLMVYTFNLHRIEDISIVRLETYEKKSKFDGTGDGLNNLERIISKNLYRMDEADEKIFLLPDHVRYIDSIIKFRNSGLNKSNIYLFGTRHALSLKDLTEMLNELSGNCEATNPKQLQENFFSKKLQPFTQLFNLGPKDIKLIEYYLNEDILEYCEDLSDPENVKKFRKAVNKVMEVEYVAPSEEDVIIPPLEIKDIDLDVYKDIIEESEVEMYL